jgi:hypothetical protein
MLQYQQIETVELGGPAKVVPAMPRVHSRASEIYNLRYDRVAAAFLSH